MTSAPSAATAHAATAPPPALSKLASMRLLLRRVWALSKPYYASEEKWKARLLLAAIIGLNLAIVYMAVLFAWLAVVFRAEIETLRSHLLQEKFAFVDNLIAWLARIERLLAPLLLLLAVLLGAYTICCCKLRIKPTIFSDGKYILYRSSYTDFSIPMSKLIKSITYINIIQTEERSILQEHI
jgi:ABC-type uncharacterized transport system fused permease/ATPase subunit